MNEGRSRRLPHLTAGGARATKRARVRVRQTFEERADDRRRKAGQARKLRLSYLATHPEGETLTTLSTRDVQHHI